MGKPLETVTICHPNDPSSPLRINREDYSPDTHVLFAEAPTMPSLPVNSAEVDWEQVYAVEGWRGLKERSEAIGFVKPDDIGWADAIPLIQMLQNESNPT